MPWETGYAGLSERNGSWNTIGTSLRYASPSLRVPHGLQRLALVEDVAAGRLVHPGQQPGDRALAAAALADQRHDLLRVDRRGSTSSTACSVFRDRLPPTLKCLVRPRVSSSGTRCGLPLGAADRSDVEIVTGSPRWFRPARLDFLGDGAGIARDLADGVELGGLVGAFVLRNRARGHGTGSHWAVDRDPVGCRGCRSVDARAADGREGVQQSAAVRVGWDCRTRCGSGRSRPPDRRTSPAAGRRSG